MKVSELGEFGLIDLLAEMVYGAKDEQAPSWRNLLIGIGDDTAAWRGDTSIQLATVDSLVQDVHFRLDIISWEELGWKALAVNLSDIAAMGGVPSYALVSLALPGDTEVDNVLAMYRGMIELAKQSGVVIVGGNISRASLLMIDVTVLGIVADKVSQPLTRSAAKPGDQIAVTGHLGTAAAGLKMLTEGLRLDPEIASTLKRAFVHPSPRLDEGRLLIAQGVKAAIDISDGLISDLKHICESSRVGAKVQIDRVPVESSVKASFPDDYLRLALSGGEDYELLFTAKAGIIDRVKKAASCPITVIGEVTAENIGEAVLVDGEGNRFNLEQMGWDHFKTK